MSHNSNPAAAPPNTGSTFRSRLFHYSIGLAIGCVITGSIISARYKAAQARAQAEQARAAEAAAAAAAAERAGTADRPAGAP